MSTLRCGQKGGLDKPQARRGIAKLSSSEGLRRGVATVHSMEIFVSLFCFVFSLLRGLVYWTNEDLISV